MITTSIGIGLAFIAMLCWGFGDFLIQKSVRKLGDWETLFVITLFGSIILIPFCIGNITEALSSFSNSMILVIGSAIIFIAALLDFEALKRGKLAIVESIWSFEIISATILSFVILGERISWFQLTLVALLIGGLMLVSYREKKISKSIFLEKGVVIALIAALIMGAANFFIGWGSRVTDPLMVNFFQNTFLAVFCGIYLIYHGKFKKSFKDFIAYPKLLVPMMISDNAAWVAYAFSMTLAPIAIATAISESYIVITVLLGLFVNKERMQTHQKFGLFIAVIVAIALATSI